MKNLQDFIDKPFAKENIHQYYKDSFLHMRPAPEVATGEVVMASLYRQVGFVDLSESKVPTHGRALQKKLQANPKDGPITRPKHFQK